MSTKNNILQEKSQESDQATIPENGDISLSQIKRPQLKRQHTDPTTTAMDQKIKKEEEQPAWIQIIKNAVKRKESMINASKIFASKKGSKQSNDSTHPLDSPRRKRLRYHIERKEDNPIPACMIRCLTEGFKHFTREEQREAINYQFYTNEANQNCSFPNGPHWLLADEEPDHHDAYTKEQKSTQSNPRFFKQLLFFG